MTINVCIFDFDGTLVDSMQDVFDSLTFAFTANGITGFKLNPEFIMQHQLSDAIAVASPKISEEAKTEIIKAFISHYDNSDYPNTHLLPGVLETLDELKARAIPCFIVSNKRRKPMLRILDNLKIRGYFADIFNPDVFADKGIKKTKPELIAELMAKHNLNKENTAYLGDMEIDVLAAKENGLMAVAVVNGYGNTENYTVKPDFVMKRISNILAFL